MKNLFVSLCLGACVALACNKNNANDGSAETRLQVRLTDNPIDAQEVNVDVRSVRVKYRNDAGDSNMHWQDLPTNARVYNLLRLQNGVDTLLATGVLPERAVKEIRLILGPDNTIKINGVVYPLTIPSGSESGLKIKVDKGLTAGLNTLIVDFDAALSVHQTGNGRYMLKPVLRIK